MKNIFLAIRFVHYLQKTCSQSPMSLNYDHWSRLWSKPLCRPSGAHLHFCVFPRVPLRFTLGYFLVAPPGLGSSFCKQLRNLKV